MPLLSIGQKGEKPNKTKLFRYNKRIKDQVFLFLELVN